MFSEERVTQSQVGVIMHDLFPGQGVQDFLKRMRVHRQIPQMNDRYPTILLEPGITQRVAVSFVNFTPSVRNRFIGGNAELCKFSCQQSQVRHDVLVYMMYLSHYIRNSPSLKKLDQGPILKLKCG